MSTEQNRRRINWYRPIAALLDARGTRYFYGSSSQAYWTLRIQGASTGHLTGLLDATDAGYLYRSSTRPAECGRHEVLPLGIWEAHQRL